MTDLVANIAVIGRVQLMPGILPVRLDAPPIECLVAHAFPNNIEEPNRKIKIDTTDCTVFTVTHRERGELDLALHANAQLVFEQSLAAISEVSIWTKAKIGSALFERFTGGHNPCDHVMPLSSRCSSRPCSSRRRAISVATTTASPSKT